MKLNDFVETVAKIAPPELALDFDNVGLLVGSDREDIKKVLVALDCTVTTVQEAIDCGADLIVTHHPIFFHGTKHLLPDDSETAAAYLLARHGIAHIAAHTNLDAANGGVNDALTAALGVYEAHPFGAEGICRIGTLKALMTLDEFARFTSNKLNTAVRICGVGTRRIERVAVLGGACLSEDIPEAVKEGADVLVTGEIRHHEALYAEFVGLCVIEAGHYETERVVLEVLIKRLQELAPGVQYNLTHREKSCLRKLD